MGNLQLLFTKNWPGLGAARSDEARARLNRLRLDIFFGRIDAGFSLDPPVVFVAENVVSLS